MAQQDVSDEDKTPSRQSSARKVDNRCYRTLYTRDTTGVEAFDELALALLPTITTERVKRLHKLRETSTQNRYQTDSAEMKMLIENINVSIIYGTLHDVASRTGTINRELQVVCQNVTSFAGFDLDKKVVVDETSFVCDFLNPATYRMISRPDWIVSRCAGNVKRVCQCKAWRKVCA